MSGPHPTLATPRLSLRPWKDEDRAPFAAMNADPPVMEFLPGSMTREQCDAMINRVRAHFDRHGFGFWAVEAIGVADCIGFVGLSVPRFESHFTPCVEVGWRLAREHWGKGYATEAARAALDFGFKQIRLEEIVSFTVPDNIRSRRVMEKLGMTHNPADDFDHPAFPQGHRLCRHVLYRLRSSVGAGRHEQDQH